MLLRREGLRSTKKRVQRLYREERLMVRRRGGRKRAIGQRGAPMETPAVANQRWRLDFVSDQLTDGRRLPDPGGGRRLHPRMPGAGGRHLDRRASGRARTRRHHRLARQAGDDRQRQRHRADLQRHPGMGRRAQGRLALHRARQAAAERLHRELQRQLRDELLNETLFRSLAHARAKLEAWRRDFNDVRPHSSLGYLTPAAYARALCGETGRRAANPDRSARRPLASGDHKVQINPELSLWLDEKRGSGHRGLRLVRRSDRPRLLRRANFKRRT